MIFLEIRSGFSPEFPRIYINLFSVFFFKFFSGSALRISSDSFRNYCKTYSRIYALMFFQELVKAYFFKYLQRVLQFFQVLFHKLLQNDYFFRNFFGGSLNDLSRIFFLLLCLQFLQRFLHTLLKTFFKNSSTDFFILQKIIMHFFAFFMDITHIFNMN